ncbi:MAG: RidA/YER057c/UK114 superfamily, group 1, partial [uncultured Ramlibacter sp.]
ERLRQAEGTRHHPATRGHSRRRLRTVRAHRQPRVHLRPYRQAVRQAVGWPARQNHGHRGGQGRRALDRRRPDGNAPRRRRRPEQGPPHRQADEPGELHLRIHGAPPRDQWRQRAVRPGVRRQGRACPQCIRRGADPDRVVRGDRDDRGGGL